MADVRVALLGAGRMGSSHARVLAATKGAVLAGVYDPDEDRARRLAALYDCPVLASPDAVPAVADAACVVVPSPLHAAVAVPLLESGVHCLIEKPFVTTVADGERVVAAAERSGARVLVGHIERFNPAVRQLREILRDQHAVLAVDTRRMSAVSGRITDVDVVSDLMVHDLDVVVDLVGQPVVDVVARAVHSPGSSGEDYVTAVLTFESGAMATFTASRITQNQIRALHVTTDSRFFTVDYSNQELHIYRQGRIGGLGEDHDPGRYVLDVGTERVFVRRVEPLAAEMAHFLAVARGDEEPEVSAAQGLRVMQLVWSIRAALEAGRG